MTLSEWYRRALQAGVSYEDVRRMSFRQWVLTQQAYKRNELARLQRMLLLVNVWSDEEVTLHDVVGSDGHTRQPVRDDRLKRHVMARRDATHDLTNNRFGS